MSGMPGITSAIDQADALIVAAGAGMGVNSRLHRLVAGCASCLNRGAVTAKQEKQQQNRLKFLS